MSDAGPGDSVRLDMAAALAYLDRDIAFVENGPLYPGRHEFGERLVAEVGDFALARRDIGTSYHLSVVVDDAAQAITEVVRGADLFEATKIHVVLQALLGLPPVDYFHHHLIRDETGKRLAKRDDARAIRHYRDEGLTPRDIRNMIGV
jgi:glutamyl-Q tRNA(Asp) synthetase